MNTPKMPNPAAESSLPSTQREHEILTLLAESGSVRITDLASRLSVTEETIRRNIRRLETQGLVTKGTKLDRALIQERNKVRSRATEQFHRNGCFIGTIRRARKNVCKVQENTIGAAKLAAGLAEFDSQGRENFGLLGVAV